MLKRGGLKCGFVHGLATAFWENYRHLDKQGERGGVLG
jgi:hypothetical protein